MGRLEACSPLDGILLKSSGYAGGDTTQYELLRSAAPSRRDATLRQLVFRGSCCFARGVRFAASKLARPFCSQQGFPPKLFCKKPSEHGLDAPAAFRAVS